MERLTYDEMSRLARDLPLFARSSLIIRTKQGSLEPFVFNKAQIYLHKKLEEQLATTGKVRALILKGRQQGCSSYVSARYYHKAIHREGTKVFILTHRDDATENLFQMVKRYHDNMPVEIKPETGADSAKTLAFSDVGSAYAVGTSGSGNVGRSDTIQLFHGSEVAFWQNTQEISSGIMQTVPEMAGTEIILESTANGMGNMFYNMCMAALRGESQYQLIFIPWYWQNEYRITPPEGFSLSEEEAEYKNNYGLDDAQIYWRRVKINDLEGGIVKFRQEYPATINEAFQVSGALSYISPETVVMARHRDIGWTDYDPFVIGLDPARFGDDRTVFVHRRGRVQVLHEKLTKIDLMDIVGRAHILIRDAQPDALFVDTIGIGAGVYDRLIELGHGRVVKSVNFAESALDGQRYKNKRAECWGEMKEWLKEGKIEDSDELQADLTTPSYKFDSSGRLLLEAKEDIKKRGMASPDIADALALTFAIPIIRPKEVKKYQMTQAPRKEQPQHFINW